MDVGFQQTWKGFSHACPSCRYVLGVEVNPLAIREDIINGLFERLRK